MSSTLKDAWLCVKESEGPRVAGKTEENLEKMREGGRGGGGGGGKGRGGEGGGGWQLRDGEICSSQPSMRGGRRSHCGHYTLYTVRHTLHKLCTIQYHALCGEVGGLIVH